MLTVTKRFQFEFTHKLPNYKGKHNQTHQHYAVCFVTMGGFRDNGSGMIIDDQKFASDIGTIIQELDSQHLNDIIDNPTIENITLHIVNKIKDKDIYYKGNLQRVRVYETDDYYAQWGKC